MAAVLMAFLAMVSVPRAEPITLVTLEYPPYEYQDGDAVDGIVVRLLRRAFDELGQEIDIQVLPWKRAQLMAKQGTVDGIFTVFKTEERLTYLDYSSVVVMPQEVSVWALEDTDVPFDGTMESLKDMSIGLVLGVSYGQKTDDALRSGLLDRLDYAFDSAQNIKKLLAGRTDVVIMNRYGALYHLHLQNGYDRVQELTPVLSSVPSYLGFSKKRQLAGLRDEFDRVFQKMIDSGEYERIIAQYYSEKSGKTDF
ncbi:transporter substrate-binding domain-containing protein [Roseibium denhamense]|nr:transporter substrate-binding domain-containing protein [Roseibium denhamense]